MLKGEFESVKIIYKLMPGFIPEPFGYGRYKEAITTAPEPKELAANISKMHKKSESPKGK